MLFLCRTRPCKQSKHLKYMVGQPSLYPDCWQLNRKNIALKYVKISISVPLMMWLPCGGWSRKIRVGSTGTTLTRSSSRHNDRALYHHDRRKNDTAAVQSRECSFFRTPAILCIENSSVALLGPDRELIVLLQRFEMFEREHSVKATDSAGARRIAFFTLVIHPVTKLSSLVSLSPKTIFYHF